MYSDCLNAIDGANGLLDNVDVSLLGLIDGESLVCHECCAFVKQCPRAYNRITHNVANLVMSRSSGVL